jgi:hypothetical protein
MLSCRVACALRQSDVVTAAKGPVLYADRSESGISSFWCFQAAGWCCFCLLCVLVVFPYFRQPSQLGYQHAKDLIVKLADGSEHRSSRTYADRIECWLDSGRLAK